MAVQVLLRWTGQTPQDHRQDGSGHQIVEPKRASKSAAFIAVEVFPMSRTPLHLLLVEIPPLWRAGLYATLPDWIPQIRISAVESAREALQFEELDSVDVLLADWRLSDMNALNFVRQLTSLRSRPPVALLAHAPGPMQVHEARRAGASAVLNERITIARLSGALYQLHSGLSVFDGEEQSESMRRLTPREVDVLRELGQGLCNKTIGQRLGITEATLKSHLRTLYDKFSVNNRTACVLAARHSGIL